MDWEGTRNELFENGWQFVADMSHPHNKALGYYISMVNDGAYGWYVKEGHPQKSQPIGDSRPRWMAGQSVKAYWM